MVVLLTHVPIWHILGIPEKSAMILALFDLFKLTPLPVALTDICGLVRKSQSAQVAGGTILNPSLYVTSMYGSVGKKGLVLEDKGLLDEAIIEFKEALRINPDLALAHSNLGVALVKKDFLDEAIREFKEALRIDPECVVAHKNFGLALYAKGLLNEAIREYRAALQISPDDVEAHQCLGVVFEQKDLHDKAIIESKEALRINPDHVYAHYNLGVTLEVVGHFANAIKALQSFIRLAPPQAAKLVERAGQFICEMKKR